TGATVASPNPPDLIAALNWPCRATPDAVSNPPPVTTLRDGPPVPVAAASNVFPVTTGRAGPLGPGEFTASNPADPAGVRSEACGGVCATDAVNAPIW